MGTGGPALAAKEEERAGGPWRYALWGALAWSLLAAASLAWNLRQVSRGTDHLALTQARAAYDKDLAYRAWAANLGGVYALVGPHLTPNPYLKVPERDVTTPGGQSLTLVNPAYMTRLVQEFYYQATGLRGHITGFKPSRPENAPDPWETKALESLAQGVPEVSQRVELDGQPYLRLMRPLVYQEACRPCHGQEGLALGQVRGGLSLAVPLTPLLAVAHRHVLLLLLTHGLLWLAGLAGIALAARGLERRMEERRQAERQCQGTLAELRQAREQVGTLRGLLPICASCKRIRDANGRWELMENYIGQRSAATFSHTYCPQCAHKLHPDLIPEE